MVAYSLWSFADSTDEVVKQHGGHMVPGWKPTVVSQSHIDRGQNKSFYVVAEAGLKAFRGLLVKTLKQDPLQRWRCLDCSSG